MTAIRREAKTQSHAEEKTGAGTTSDFPPNSETDDHDLRGDAAAVPAHPSIKHDDQSQGSSFVKSCRIAFMNTTRNMTRRESQEGLPTSDAEIRRETQSWKRRVVDLSEDEGVWSTVDDTCNSCCHGSIRCEEDKWKKKGFRCHLKDAMCHMYGGIANGSTQSGGKYRTQNAKQPMQARLNAPGAIISIDHLDLGEYLDFAQKSEPAEPVIDKTSDAYVDAYIDGIELRETTGTSNDLRWPVTHRSSNVDEMLVRFSSCNYGCEYCGRWYPQSPFPFTNCNHCGARP